MISPMTPPLSSECNSSDSRSDIWKVEMDPATGLPLGEPSRVIDHPANDTDPTLLPDGEHFLFVSDRGGDSYDLYVADTDGVNVRLVDSSRPLRPAGQGIGPVSPDGTWLTVLPAAAPLASYLLPFDPITQEVTGQGRRIVASNAEQTRYQAMSWSADGEYLAVGTFGDLSLVGVRVIEDPTGETPTEVVWPIDEAFKREHPNGIPSHISPGGGWIGVRGVRGRS